VGVEMCVFNPTRLSQIKLIAIFPTLIFSTYVIYMLSARLVLKLQLYLLAPRIEIFESPIFSNVQHTFPAPLLSRYVIGTYLQDQTLIWHVHPNRPKHILSCRHVLNIGAGKIAINVIYDTDGFRADVAGPALIILWLWPTPNTCKWWNVSWKFLLTTC